MEIEKEVIEAARRAWNVMEAIFSSEPDFFEPESVEFELFYDQLVGHLLEEETQA